MAITVEARSDLISIVVGMFNGAPGAAILSDLTVAFEAGQTRLQIATNLAKTAEYLSVFPEFLTNAEFATKLVDNMLGSLVSTAGKAEAVTLLTAKLNAANTSTPASKAAARADVSIYAMDLLKAVPTTDGTFGAAAAAFANKVEVATYYSVDSQQNPATVTEAQEVIEDVDNTAASVTAAKTEVDGGSNPGQTYFLKVTADAVNGGSGDDVINALPEDSAGAVDTTFSAFDSIDGGNGNDTLNIYTVAGGNTAMATSTTVKNVEIINIYNDGAIFETAAGPAVVAAGRFEGATQIWQRGDANNVTGLTAATTAGFADQILANTVATSTGAASANIALSAIGAGSTLGTSGTNTVNVTGSLASGGALTLTATGTASGVTTTVNSAVDATVIINGAVATTLNAAGSTGDLTYTVATGKANATTGSGDDTVNITATDKATVATGAGDDTLSIDAALATGSSINLGAGNDILTAAGGSFGAGITVDGGEGSDAISAALINAGNAANVKNFELLDLSATTATALDLDLLTGSTVTGLVLNGGAGNASVNNVAAGLGLTVINDNTGNTTVGVKGATSATATSDAFTVTFNDVTAATTAATASANIVADGVESITVVSGGTGLMSNTLTVVDTDALSATNNTVRTITVSGDKDLTLDFAGTIGSTGTGNGVSTVNAGAATGDVVIDFTTATALNLAAAGLTVTTGSGDDTITLAGKATVVAGAGDDTITSAAAGGTFTGGAGDDTFDVSAAVATAATEVGSVFTTITDLQADDAIDFGIGTSFESEAVVLGVGVNNLDQALAAAVTTAGEVSWFQYGSNTYVVASADATFGAGDVVVKLTGLVDLSDATLAGTVLTMA